MNHVVSFHLFSGLQGLDGRDGLPGEPGLDGIPGRNGIDGIPGFDGTPGIKLVCCYHINLMTILMQGYVSLQMYIFAL